MAIKKIINAEYHQSSVPAYRGNPLIEALPDYLSYSASSIVNMMEQLPGEIHPQASSIQRSEWLRHACSRLFIPLSRHYELHELLTLLILQGYENRCPLTVSHMQELQDAYSAQQKGEIPDSINYEGRAGAEPLTLSLIGVSGVGKSYTTQRILGAMYPQVIHHNNPEFEEVFDQVVYLKVEVPHDGSVKAMCMNLITELGHITGNNYAELISNTMTLERIRTKLAAFLCAHYVGLIVLDEMQNLLSSHKNKTELFNFIVGLSNSLNIPILFIGTPKLYEICEQGLRVSRRLGTMGNLKWNRMLYRDRNWKRFIAALWQQNILADEDLEIPEEIEQGLYEFSQGIPDLLVKLFFLSQERSLVYAKSGKDREEILYYETIKSVYDDYFENVKNMVEILKSGEQEKITEIEDLSLPDSIFDDAMLNEHKEICNAVYEGSDESGDKEDENNQSLKNAVLKLLRNCSITINAQVRDYIDEQIKQEPTISMAKLAALSLEHFGTEANTGKYSKTEPVAVGKLSD